jgi:hypothetical protein
LAIKSSDPLGFSSQQVQVVNWDSEKRPQVLALSEGPKLAISPSQPPAVVESLAGVRLYRNTSSDKKKVVWQWVNPRTSRPPCSVRISCRRRDGRA